MGEVPKAKHGVSVPSPGTPLSQHLPKFIHREALKPVLWEGYGGWIT